MINFVAAGGIKPSNVEIVTVAKAKIAADR
jgi:hypothetical protein